MAPKRPPLKGVKSMDSPSPSQRGGGQSQRSQRDKKPQSHRKKSTSTADQIAEMEKKKKKTVKKAVPETVPEVDLQDLQALDAVLAPVQAIVNKLYSEQEELTSELETLGVVHSAASAQTNAPEQAAAAAPKPLSDKKREKAVRIWHGFAGDKLAEMASSARQLPCLTSTCLIHAGRPHV